MSYQSKCLVVFGADGATGQRIVSQARARGHRVRACVHSLDDDKAPAEGLSWHEADVMTPGGLGPIISGADAVISAVGIHAGPDTAVFPPDLHTEGTLNILTAMRSEEVDRLVVISASFVETMERGPVWFRMAAKMGLKAIFEQMEDMERILRATETLRWTAVRPGWLLDEAPSGDYGVFDDVIPPDLIRTRTGDLADFMLRVIEDDTHIRATPAIARAEPASKSGPDAVLSEMAG